MKTTLASILFLIISFSCNAQKVSLALNLKIGNTYYTNSAAHSKISQIQNGQTVDFDVNIDVKTSYKVIKITDTVYSLEVRYKKLSLKINSVKGNASYSSINAAKNDATSQLLAALIDKPFQIKLSKTGKVIAVEDIEKMADNLLSSIQGSNQQQKEQLKGQVMKFFGEQSFKERVQQTLAVYPAAKISKYDSWDINSHIQSLGEMQVKTTYHLTNISNDSYMIHGVSNISLDKNKMSQIDGVSVSYNLSGIITSDAKVNKMTGWIISTKLNQNVSGDYKIKDSPKFPGGMTVPIKLITNIITSD